jgi:hypothetical protein
MAIGLSIYALFALTFCAFKVQQSEGDGEVYFNLLRRFFGETPDFAFAYQFGNAFWNAPFFLVGKAFASAFGYQPKIFHVGFEEIAITLASNAAFVLTLYLGWRILRELDLPRGPAVLLLTAFGTPLFYYAIFAPAAKHAADTLYLTAATLVFLLASRRRAWRDPVLLGVLAAASINTRWGVNFAFFAAMAVAALRVSRWRDVAIGTATTVVVGAVMFLLPALRGVPYYIPKVRPHGADSYVAAGIGPIAAAPTDSDGLIFDPTIPLKMLVSEHRGLFLWTPLTAFATLGFALAVVRASRGRRDRGFHLTIAGGALAILAIHVIWSKWDGGLSFSQRFLTSLFPVFLIGVAELVRRWGAIVYAPLAVCVAWAVGAAFVHTIGYDGISERDGIGKIVEVARTDRSNLAHKVWRDGRRRWAYLWALPQGRDPEHVNGP